jgi:hypothetical protein
MKNNFDDLIIGLNAMGRIVPQQQEVGPLATLRGSNVPAESQCFGIGEGGSLEHPIPFHSAGIPRRAWHCGPTQQDARPQVVVEAFSIFTSCCCFCRASGSRPYLSEVVQSSSAFCSWPSFI